jgi:hypothetical protein
MPAVQQLIQQLRANNHIVVRYWLELHKMRSC